MNQREFEIQLSKLVNETLQTGLSADEVLQSLLRQVATERRMIESRRRTEMSY